ncbi:serine/threonine-protein kinase [Micromonospora sp. NPDC050980]|uniref:serine/threonine-protein kinase n=1 Tax=Micromonospora sp. NPDC050980 TaxID=3155161 RepID=UPI0033E5D8F1
MSFSFLTGVSVLRGGVVIDDRFRVVRLAGEGASAEVYRAWDMESEREVAIKLQPPRGFESTATFARGGELIVDEGGLGDTLRGIPGVPAHIRRGSHGERAYLAMDFVDGILLRELIERSRPLYTETVVSVLAQLCEILSEVHGRGIVHHDIKPDNIMVGHDGRIWLFDFGIVSTCEDEEYTGCGTPGYAAPEQYHRQHHQPQVDVYSLGAMLFEMSALRLPYQEHSGRPEEQTEQFPPGSLTGMPAVLRTLGTAMVAFDPADRPKSVSDILARLRPLLPTSGTPPHPKAPRPDPAAWYRVPSDTR